MNQHAQSGVVCGHSRSQLHMAHEFSVALQQMRGIGQRCALKEAHVYVRSEYIDIAEGPISQARDRTAVVQQLPNFVPALSHDLKPPACDGCQLTCVLLHPCVDGGIPLDGGIESQQFRSHARSTFCFREYSYPAAKTRNEAAECRREPGLLSAEAGDQVRP